MMPPSATPGWRQSGQALSEFLVVALALLPLFLLVPVIAKYQDISHFTQMASRYAAFDAMTRNDIASTWKPEGQLADEVRRRFFSNSDAPIKTYDVAGNFDAHRNLFWQAPGGNPLLEDFGSAVRVTYGTGSNETHGAGFQAASDTAPYVLAGELQLASRGIYTANVSVSLAHLPAGLRFYEPFDRLDLIMSRSTSLLLNPWTAKDPEQVERKISDSPLIFPVGSLVAVSPVVDAAVSLIELPGGLSGPKLGRLDFWRDVVPQDRLRSPD